LSFRFIPRVSTREETIRNPRKCKLCGEYVPIHQREAHIRIKHPEIKAKKKFWKYFEK